MKPKASSAAARAASGSKTIPGKAGKLGSQHGKTMKQFEHTSGISPGGRSGKLPRS